jgi:hypothetical protein
MGHLDTRSSDNSISDRLFTPDGLPWTTRLDLGWNIILFSATGGLFGIPLGIYLGLWLKAKGRSGSVLVAYLLVACFCAVMFLPDKVVPYQWCEAAAVLAVISWFAAAFLGRREILNYYAQRESSLFRLTFLSTVLFGVWYLNYELRPVFPSIARS